MTMKNITLTLTQDEAAALLAMHRATHLHTDPKVSKAIKREAIDDALMARGLENSSSKRVDSVTVRAYEAVDTLLAKMQYAGHIAFGRACGEDRKRLQRKLSHLAVKGVR